MNIEGIQALIDDHVNMIAVSARSLQDAKELSGKFLMAQALLASFLRDFEDDKSKLMTLVEIAYATALKIAEGKTITEKKISVSLDKTYTDARESFDQIDNIRTYIKTHIKIFENAHLMYRQYGRD